MKYKVGKSKIEGAGKGLFVKKPFREGETIGLAHVDDQPTKIVGSFHNHSENPNAGSIRVGNKRYIVALRTLKPGEEITTDYRQQPELEQPEDFMRKGGMVKMPKDKPEKSKKFSRSLDATNRLFTENRLFEKPKSRKRKVFDPHAKYYADGGEYGRPLGTGVSQNFIGNKENFKVGGIPELPLRDNRVNYNAYVNAFEPIINKSANKSFMGKVKDYFDRPPGPLMLGMSKGAVFNKEIKNPDYFLDLMKINKYSPKNKKYFEDLIANVKRQGNVASEKQYEELQRLKTGDMNYGKKGYKKGGMVSELTDKQIEKLKAQGYTIEYLD
jgi:hypothetical protein